MAPASTAPSRSLLIAFRVARSAVSPRAEPDWGSPPPAETTPSQALTIAWQPTLPADSDCIRLTLPGRQDYSHSRGEQMANTQATSLPLFPELPPPPAVGIARMAADSTDVDQGHLVEFRSLPVRSILTRVASRRGLRFAWGINPYRGCEFACRYCYARYTHEFLEPAPIGSGGDGEGEPQAWATAFERKI